MSSPYETCWNEYKHGLVKSVNLLLEAQTKKLPIPDIELQLMVIQKMMIAINELEIKNGIQESVIATKYI